MAHSDVLSNLQKRNQEKRDSQRKTEALRAQKKAEAEAYQASKIALQQRYRAEKEAKEKATREFLANEARTLERERRIAKAKEEAEKAKREAQRKAEMERKEQSYNSFEASLVKGVVNYKRDGLSESFLSSSLMDRIRHYGSGIEKYHAEHDDIFERTAANNLFTFKLPYHEAELFALVGAYLEQYIKDFHTLFLNYPQYRVPKLIDQYKTGMDYYLAVFKEVCEQDYYDPNNLKIDRDLLEVHQKMLSGDFS